MSCYEWERGTIKLPTAGFAKVKEAVRRTQEAHAKAIFSHTQAFWKALPAKFKRNKELYCKAANAYIYGNTGNEQWRPKVEGLPGWRGIQETEQRHGLTEDLQSILTYRIFSLPKTETREGFNGAKIEYTNWVMTDKPRRVTQADMKAWFPCTNRATEFSCGEPSISFDVKSKTVTWDVPENNHARDYGREHPVAKALFAALDRVNWTRGSGGQIIGNDEYNRDAGREYEGGGGSYVVDEYGPKAKRAPAYAWR